MKLIIVTGLSLLLATSACGGGESEVADAPQPSALVPGSTVPTTAPPPSQTPPLDSVPSAAPSVEKTRSAGAVAVGCSDPLGDSDGSLDLRSARVTAQEDDVTLRLTFTGPTPTSDAVLWSLISFGDGRQLGYKLVDGERSAYFIADLNDGGQENLAGEPELTPTSLVAVFPGAGLKDVSGSVVAISEDGVDVDECELP